MYLIIFPNPHDKYRELRVPFSAVSDELAIEKVKDILKIWYEDPIYIEGSINNHSVQLFNMKEIRINV